jgi:hypothetical protein
MANYRFGNYRLTYVLSFTAAMSLSMPLLLVFDDAGGELYSLELELATRGCGEMLPRRFGVLVQDFAPQFPA